VGKIPTNAPYKGTVFVRSSNGTIVPMADHRIRLTDKDVRLIVAALRARQAMTRSLRKHRVQRLIERLESTERGNPKWRIDEYGQTHEEDLDEDSGFSD